MSKKTILISGASRGIGRSAALKFAQDGYTVFAGVRNQQAADDLIKTSDNKVIPVFLDIADENSIQSFIDEYASQWQTSGLQGLINNAGVMISGCVEHTTLEDWQRQFNVNLFGQIELTRRLLPYIRKAKGRIIFTGSLAGKVSFPMIAPYCASKFALEGMVDALRREMYHFGVSVSIVEPGAIETAMLNTGDGSVQKAIDVVQGDSSKIYQQIGHNVKEAMVQSRQVALPPEKVVAAFEHALCAPKPKARYVVGDVGAKLNSALKRLLPDALFDALFRKIIKA